MFKHVSDLTGLFAEFKRRKVFRLAAVYILVAWLILQVTRTVFLALHLPDWTATLIIVPILIGFPIAIIITWYFKLTPEDFKRTEAVEDQQSDIGPAGSRKFQYLSVGLR